MTHDPESILRPLRSETAELERLRSGPPAAGPVVRVAWAAEAVLRRILRDDPTAPVELRLKALAPDDLATPDLLAELRRRDRLPMELAAAFHELAAAARRLEDEGGEVTPRDRELALGVADGLERHVGALAFDAPLEDPVLAADETLIPNPEDDDRAHPVPHVSRAGRPAWPWVMGAAALALALLAVVWLGRGSDPLAEGEALYRRGDTAQALARFQEAAREEPEAALPRLYLAQIHRQAGRRDQAAEQLRAGLAAHPDDAGLNTELGFLMLESGRAEEAAARFRKAVEIDRTSARAWAGLVTSLRRAGRPAQAERVLGLAPPEVRALLSRDLSPAAAPAGTAPPGAPPAAAPMTPAP